MLAQAEVRSQCQWSDNRKRTRPTRMGGAKSATNATGNGNRFSSNATISSIRTWIRVPHTNTRSVQNSLSMVPFLGATCRSSCCFQGSSRTTEQPTTSWFMFFEARLVALLNSQSRIQLCGFDVQVAFFSPIPGPSEYMPLFSVFEA